MHNVHGQGSLTVFSTTRVEDFSCGRRSVDLTASFRALDNIPRPLAQRRLDACIPVGTRRASGTAIDEAFAAQLDPTLLRFACAEPLDVARLALVSTQWAAAVRGYAGAGTVLKLLGLAKHFPTPAEAAAAVPLIKAVQRPSLALRAGIGQEYKARVIARVPMMFHYSEEYDLPEDETFTMRAGKLGGIPDYSFVWRCVGGGLILCLRMPITAPTLTRPYTPTASARPATRAARSAT